jgi:hypothetical protein
MGACAPAMNAQAPQGVPAKWIEAVANDLVAHRGASVLVAGSRQPASVHALDPATGERVEVTLHPGDLIRVAPGIAHALVVHASGMAVEFAPEPFDPADTKPFPVVSQ